MHLANADRWFKLSHRVIARTKSEANQLPSLVGRGRGRGAGLLRFARNDDTV